MYASIPPFTVHTFDDSPLVSDCFVEHVDATRLQQLINVKYDKPYTKDDRQSRVLPYKSVREHLQAIYSHVRDGELKVYYKVPKRQKRDQGRVFAHMSRSLACLPKDVRGYLSNGNYTDHDVVNAHCTLIVDDAARGDIHLPTLHQYVHDREANIKHICGAYKVDREIAKKLPLILIYGGSVRRWAKDNNVKYSSLTCEENWTRDLQTIGKRLRKANKHTWDALRARIAKENKQRKASGLPARNAKSVMLSLYAQNLERRVIEHVYSKLDVSQRRGFSYSYDGFATRDTVKTEDLNTWSRELFPSLTWQHKAFGGEDIRSSLTNTQTRTSWISQTR